MRLAPLPALLLLAALPGAARGQTIEITPVAGYRFGGGNVNTNAWGDFEVGSGFELDDAASFGIHLTRPFDDAELELLYARQRTRLRDDAPPAGIAAFDLAVESWQAGAAWSFRETDARVRPFVGLAVGLTRLLPEPERLDDETRFSFSLGAGVRLRLADRLRLRLEARWFAAVFGGDGTSYRATGMRTLSVGTSQLLSQLDLRAGLGLRF